MKQMRRFIAFLLAAILLAAAVPVQAAQKAMEISFLDTAQITSGHKATVLSTKINSISDGVIVFTLTDTVGKTVIYTETRSGITAGSTEKWSVPYYDKDMSNSKNVKKMNANFVMDGKNYQFSIYYNYSAKKGEAPVITIEKATWYPNNTACSFGPNFREVRPRLTDKWYTFTPVDLTIQGRQEFDYVASNLYLIGKVYVDVYGDQFTVTYHNYYADQGGNTQTQSEFLYFFPDLDSVRNVEPETMGVAGFQFGQNISIQNDLAGDTNVLMFVRNRVNYCDYVNNSHKLTRYWPNLPERKDLRNQMIQLMNRPDAEEGNG